MYLLAWLVVIILLACQLETAAGVAIPNHPASEKIAPKVLIINLFLPEAEIWYEKMPSTGLGNLLALNISVPGLSVLFPHVHCVEDHSVCQVTTGEAEINAAATAAAVVLSDRFDLSRTYFLIAGIAGVNPKYSTLGGVALARYAVQVALQYEFDAREIPGNFSSGYFPFGTLEPNQYPSVVYGTEVMELNEALRDMAYSLAVKARLVDNVDAMLYRAKYSAVERFSPAALEPSVVKCDSATSDVYYSGTLLSEAFENITAVWTNGSGIYCMTAQEDNAILAVLVRAAMVHLVDFGRVILMRTGANFDRPPPNISAYDHLLVLQQNGFRIANLNMFVAGVEIIKGIIDKWDCTFEKGIQPTNYIGDVFGSLGGKPDFGPEHPRLEPSARSVV